MILASMVILITIVYFCLYSYFIARRMLELRQLPHQDHKVNNLFVRMQASHYIPGHVSFISPFLTTLKHHVCQYQRIAPFL